MTFDLWVLVCLLVQCFKISKSSLVYLATQFKFMYVASLFLILILFISLYQSPTVAKMRTIFKARLYLVSVLVTPTTGMGETSGVKVWVRGVFVVIVEGWPLNPPSWCFLVLYTLRSWAPNPLPNGALVQQQFNRFLPITAVPLVGDFVILKQSPLRYQERPTVFWN